MPKLYFTYSLLIGVLSSMWISFVVDLQFLWKLFLVFIFILFLFSFFCFILKKWKSFVILALVFLLGNFLGLIKVQDTFTEPETGHVSYFFDEEGVFEGKIVAERDVRAKYVNYTVELESALIDSGVGSTPESKPIHGKILVQTQKFPLYQYGDILRIQGAIQEPADEEDFSYKNYLSRYEIYGINTYGKIEKIGEEVPSKFMAWLLRQKHMFLERINKLYHEPQSSFLAGLLIGDRKGMSEEITEDFRITGLAHIVAVSGSNITILLAIIITLFGFLPRMASFVLSVATIIIFTIFVGMSAAVVRAAVMGVIGLLAVQLGRPKIPLTAMLLTMTIMAWYQPKILAYDVGFQLSVSAILGVIWLVPLLPSFFQKLPEQFGIKEAVALTLAAQITTLPVSVYHFGTFSLIAPVANLFVVPAIPFAMFFGFLSLIPIPFFSEFFVLITTFLLDISLWFAKVFAAIPFAQLVNLSLPIWAVVLYFMVLILIFIHKRK